MTDPFEKSPDIPEDPREIALRDAKRLRFGYTTLLGRVEEEHRRTQTSPDALEPDEVPELQTAWREWQDAEAVLALFNATPDN